MARGPRRGRKTAASRPVRTAAKRAGPAVRLARARPAAARAAGRGRAPRASAIGLQIMWNRLIAVVEEQSQVLIRTGFSTSTREAGDVSAGVFETRHGKMLAQAVTGTPGHINSMAEAVKHFIRRFPVAGMRPGDVFITNDPWLGTGHLHDFTVVTPTFRKGKVVALFACTSHVVDIGGIGFTADGRQVYHEGLYVPIMPLAREGRINEWFLDIVRANVREPVQVVGDIYSLAACNDIGCQRLVEMMDEFGLESLDELGRHIIETSRAAKLEAIRRLPFGTYRNAMRVDGYDEPVDLVAALTIAADGITVDFTGTSPQSPWAINVPYCYADAYTSFGVNCVIAPMIPNNAGSLEVVKVVAPPGSILNAQPPCAVAARGTTGQMLPDVVFGCLQQAMPGGVPAEGTSGLWNLTLCSGPGRTDPKYPYPADATTFDVTSFHSGGAGARPTLDGLSATAFPSGVRNVPVEITETITPLVVWQKEFRPDSGGPGRFRGGTGQIMHVANREGAPFAISPRFDRIRHPPRGRAGGLDGGAGRVRIASGPEFRPKGFQTVPPGDLLIIEMPGGAGYGDPKTREVKRVAADARNGLVSPVAARRHYGVAVDRDGKVNEEATRRLRAP
ncbi:MAG: hydantoinase B/oxoprolinase family protein [Proteobacteria bacterium]|nr:hydantoinase B/oxoprolinase family protein [Pseudomonadota bacterium]